MASTSRPTGYTLILLRKNLLIKRKNPLKWLIEVLLPVAWIAIMGGLKSTSKDVAVPDGWSIRDTSSNMFQRDSYWGIEMYTPEPTFSGYLRDLASSQFFSVLDECKEAKLQGRVSSDVTSPNAWPAACRATVRPRKIAVAPDNEFTRNYFLKAVATWYPRVPLDAGGTFAVPAVEDSVLFFKDEAALEAHIARDTYGTSFDAPIVDAAIVFQSTPATFGVPMSLDYTLRFNSTNGAIYAMPSTAKSVFNPLQRRLDPTALTQNGRSGQAILQTLVTRFALCVPDWNGAATTGACTVAQSVAVSNSTEVDDTLFRQVERDEQWSRSTYDFDPPFDIADIPAASKELLLKPLRQLPQAVSGAHVFPFPIRGYTDSTFYSSMVYDYFSLLFVMANLLLLSSVLVVLITEKETKSRELMKILGVPDNAIVLSWYLTYGAVFAVSAVIQMGVAVAILFPHSDPGLLFAFFVLFGWSILSFGYMVSAIFSNARAGTYVGIIGFFSMYLISTAFTASSSVSSKTWASLLSPIAMTFGIQSLATAEASGMGLTAANVNAIVNGHAFSTTLCFFVLDIVLYTVVGLYLERVVPKDYGVTLPWYFPLSPSFWAASCRKNSQHLTDLGAVTPLDASSHADSIEPVGEKLRQQETSGEALQIQNLRKAYASGKVAVHGLNLTLYKNQITCLLGHNGAGKTTLMSMLTGMLSATSGDACVNGLRLSSDLDKIRHSLGMCPQHDVLYGDLTVEQHLVFYGQIKGFRGPALDEQVTAKITEVGLTEKRHVVSSALSGGMKRKLCLAIALLGDSSLVFLDEPTSGMDPYSRRSTWETIMNNRQNRIIVLTTHFMDEADILGDRIAIMAEGELRCCGSSLFLKNRYGAGYTFSLVKVSQAACDVGALAAFIESHVGDGVKLLSNVGTEVSFQLPLDSAKQFPAMFGTLEADLALWGVLSYGISVTTMEEVFIKVAEVGDVHGQHTLVNKPSQLDQQLPSNESDKRPLSNPPVAKASRPAFVFGIHFQALFLKRARTAKRDVRVVLFGTVLPVLFLILGFALVDSSGVNRNEPKLRLYPADAVPFDSPVPYTCSGTATWGCDVAKQLPRAVELKVTPFDTPLTPTVFNVQYDNLTTTQTATLQAGQAVLATQSGTYGAYVLHGNAATRTFGYDIAANTTAVFAPAVFKARLDESLLRAVTNNKDLTLAVSVYPLPVPSAMAHGSDAAMSETTSLFVTLAFAFFTASIVPYLVDEKHPTHNAKHQQLVSGVSLPAFWLANFAWDLTLFAIPCACALIAIYGFGIPAFVGAADAATCTDCIKNPFSAVVVLFILFGPAIVSFCYVLSYLFTSPSASQTFIVMINLLLGVVLVTISSILDILPDIVEINKPLKYIWRVSPLFCLGNGLSRLSNIHSGMSLVRVLPSTHALDPSVVGVDVVYLALEAMLYPLLALGIDYAASFPALRAKFHRDPPGDAVADAEVDQDVQAEADRIARGDTANDAIVLSNIHKVYKADKKGQPNKVALLDLSLGLPKGECFGYLGINGAGKTSTMKILTGDILPSEGSGSLGGFNILSQQLEVRRLIGYCPSLTRSSTS